MAHDRRDQRRGQPADHHQSDGVRGFNLRAYRNQNEMSGIHCVASLPPGAGYRQASRPSGRGRASRGITKRWMDKKPPPPKPGDMLVLAAADPPFPAVAGRCRPNYHLSLERQSGPSEHHYQAHRAAAAWWRTTASRTCQPVAPASPTAPKQKRDLAGPSPCANSSQARAPSPPPP